MAASWYRRFRLVASALLFALACAACSAKHVVLGAQCPSPNSGFASLAVRDAGGAKVFGTSCAPCDSSKEKLDKHGCPIFVTFASCGGDICLGDTRIPRPTEADQDAGDEGDAASAKEDSGGL